MRGGTEYSRVLLDVAGRAEAVPAWLPYAHYCRNRESGLRSVALTHLDAFLADAQRWPETAQREFAVWLCGMIDAHGCDPLDLTPHPLVIHLLRPTLLAWAEREAVGTPHRWLGMYFSGYGHVGVRAGISSPSNAAESHLRRALEITPEDQLARVRLIELLIGGLDYDAHHLPEYYIGDAHANRAAADRVAELIEGVRTPRTRTRLRGELATARALLDDWLQFSTEGGADFAEWCRLRGRSYRWRTHYYYDEEE